MSHSLIELRKRPHFSISALKEFLACPRRYRLRYIDRTTPDFRPAALALGIVWHETIAAWLDGGAAEAVEEMLRDGLRARLRETGVPVLFDDEEEDEDHFIERAVEMLHAFLSAVPRPAMVLGTEIAFETTLTHPVTGEVLPLPVIGAIDAVVREADGGGSLWELKSAKRKWTRDAVEFDLQTTLYRKAARELGFDGVRLRLLVTTKAAQPEVEIVDLDRNDGDEAELAEIFIGVSRAIGAGVDYPTRGWQCRTCPYASSCR